MDMWSNSHEQLAREYQAQLQRQAEEARLISMTLSQSEAYEAPAVDLRQQVGKLLVEMGERLQGERIQQALLNPRA